MQTIRPTTDLVRSKGTFENQVKDSTGALATIYHTRPGELPRFVGGTVAGTILSGTVPDLAVYVESTADGAVEDIISVETGNPSPIPNNDFNHILFFWAIKAASGGGAAVTCQLRQGYSNETDDLGTFITALEATSVSTTATQYRKRLTRAEAALITDYTDLQLRFIMKSTHDGGGVPQRVRLLQARLELPNDEEPFETRVQLTPTEFAMINRGEAID